MHTQQTRRAQTFIVFLAVFLLVLLWLQQHMNTPTAQQAKQTHNETISDRTNKGQRAKGKADLSNFERLDVHGRAEEHGAARLQIDRVRVRFAACNRSCVPNDASKSKKRAQDKTQH